MKPEFGSISLNRDVYISFKKGSLSEQKLGQGIIGKITDIKNDYLSEKSALGQFFLSKINREQRMDLWLLKDQFGSTWELPYEDIFAVTYMKEIYK